MAFSTLTRNRILYTANSLNIKYDELVSSFATVLPPEIRTPPGLGISFENYMVISETDIYADFIETFKDLPIVLQAKFQRWVELVKQTEDGYVQPDWGVSLKELPDDEMEIYTALLESRPSNILLDEKLDEIMNPKTIIEGWFDNNYSYLENIFTGIELGDLVFSQTPYKSIYDSVYTTTNQNTLIQFQLNQAAELTNITRYGNTNTSPDVSNAQQYSNTTNQQNSPQVNKSLYGGSLIQNFSNTTTAQQLSFAGQTFLVSGPSFTKSNQSEQKPNIFFDNKTIITQATSANLLKLNNQQLSIAGKTASNIPMDLLKTANLGITSINDVSALRNTNYISSIRFSAGGTISNYQKYIDDTRPVGFFSSGYKGTEYFTGNGYDNWFIGTGTTFCRANFSEQGLNDWVENPSYKLGKSEDFYSGWPEGVSPVTPSGDAQLFSENLTSQIPVSTSITTFTTTHPYKSGSLKPYFNGQRQVKGVTFNELTSTTFSFTFNVTSGNVVNVDYEIL